KVMRIRTKVDGSDVADYLNRLFEVLNTPKNKRADLPDYLANFEFVNGGLFADNIASPRFSTKSRKMLIECGSELDWSDINPDIFGSMIQAVVHPDQRGGMGMHYTSVTNIMKVIEPLFLDELYAELENIEDNIDPKLKPSRLRKLHDRIAEIKIFDPACGSGNFLIIAFKELRKLEMEVIRRLKELDKNENQDDLFGNVGLDSSFSRIKLTQFYGIELDDFAHEVAILSLWLAEHQMNVEFKAEFGMCEPALPLRKGGHIVCNNALMVEWEAVCPSSKNTFIIGNPPYLGDKLQNQQQKNELKEIFSGIKNSKAVDYITGWFIKASEYIRDGGEYAFVSTNSICQGIQVPLLWPHIFKRGLEISFCHRGFIWGNNAKNKAAVICVIVGVRQISSSPKYIFDKGLKFVAENINAYLLDAPNLIVEKNAKSISKLPPILTGNIPRDKGYLMLSSEEKEELIRKHPEASPLVRRIVGSKEYINGIQRWCLWISDEQKEIAYSIPELRSRLEKIVEYRTNGSERGKLGISTPYKFERTLTCSQSQLVIPRVSSERRKYIPVGYLSSDVIISDAAQAIYDAAPFIFSLISSRMHMCWVAATAGRMKSDFRYSSGVCYNSFPFPVISLEQKNKLNVLAMNILSSRENFPESNLADLYDPDRMPEELLKAHQKNDDFVDSIYKTSGFVNDNQRLECLFNLYNQMTGGQNA
ncbi:DNA methyltransferase, partial [Pseudoalteromonas sp. S201]|uniref:class I SAM-dependent DNA methyltransferase n=1 Tax=Pseudoalteromonas sp. S201 TaxID=579519 RepID=UPI00110CAD63